LPFFILSLNGPAPIIADEFGITEQHMREAKTLFSGPGEGDYYRADAVLVSAAGSAYLAFHNLWAIDIQYQHSRHYHYPEPTGSGAG
jgi:hypothetical protein